MTAENPAVTVGLPVFNGENYLSGALESLMNQDFEDFELVISDNACFVPAQWLTADSRQEREGDDTSASGCLFRAVTRNRTPTGSSTGFGSRPLFLMAVLCHRHQ